MNYDTMQKKTLPPPLSVDGQIENLKSIKLIIENEEYAKDMLNRISYFRLIKAYGLGLKPKNGDYTSGTTFEYIVKIYEFNAKLRRAISPLIEDVEISLRCRLANHISCTYGSLGYENAEHFQDEDIHCKILNDFHYELERRKSLFISNFRKNYVGGKIPFYAAVELFTFGMLSKFYSNMKNNDKKAVAAGFNVGYTYLESWIKSITNVRNICAHYGRLYNTKLGIKPILYKEYPGEYNYRVFGTLLTLKYLVADASLWRSFETDLTAIIEEYLEFIDLKAIGFPESWHELLFRD